MAGFSRRSFLTRLMGTLGSWLGVNALPAQARRSMPQAPVASNTSGASQFPHHEAHLLKCTFYVFDMNGRKIRQSTSMEPCVYDMQTGLCDIRPRVVQRIAEDPSTPSVT
jgi:hypothetical protein